MSSDADGIKDRVRKAISSGNRPTRTVLSSLLAAHDELGYLPDEAIEEVAVLSNTTINEVWGVASFYTNFRFTPPGRHVIEVCVSRPRRTRSSRLSGLNRIRSRAETKL